jgi:hypothetical protein
MRFSSDCVPSRFVTPACSEFLRSRSTRLNWSA